jgi:hypothetical protein
MHQCREYSPQSMCRMQNAKCVYQPVFCQCAKAPERQCREGCSSPCAQCKSIRSRMPSTKAPKKQLISMADVSCPKCDTQNPCVVRPSHEPRPTPSTRDIKIKKGIEGKGAAAGPYLAGVPRVSKKYDICMCVCAVDTVAEMQDRDVGKSTICFVEVPNRRSTRLL